MKTVSLLLICISFVPQIGNSQSQSEPTAQAYSLTGKPLYSNTSNVKSLAKSDSLIRLIQSKLPLSENDYIEIGRQLVATTRYKEAVENYTNGLNQFPNSFKLLRLRGHRYLTLRKLDLAGIDLLKARKLIKAQPDSWEVDAEGKKTDTYQHQIEYHLGVYYFLNKSYKEAVATFEKSLKEAHQANEIVGTTDWLYNAYQRNGEKNKAEQLLTTITLDFKTDQDQAYFRRVMLYKGVIKPNELVNEALPIEKMSIQEVTKLYGLANWYGFQGNKQKAKELYAKITQSTSWPAFAYLASEIELLEK